MISRPVLALQMMRRPALAPRKARTRSVAAQSPTREQDYRQKKLKTN